MHAAPEEHSPQKAAVLAVSDFIITVGVHLGYLVIALFVVMPMAARRRISGHRVVHAGAQR